MSWPTQRLASWDDFTRFAARFRFGDPITVADFLRGQPDADWPLRSTLTRLIPRSLTEDKALEIEAGLLREFQSHARSHLSPALIPEEA